MFKKPKNKIIVGALAVGLLCGSVVYKNNFRKTENIINNKEALTLLYSSKTDLPKALNELNQLKIRTYSDLSWGTNGREKYFESWKNARKYNYYNLPKRCRVNYAILILQSLIVSYTDKCDIYYGKWKSPYTNNIIYTKSDIQIDHIVPLKNVWNSGGNNWTQSKRLEYANTKYNLLISETELNRKKGDKAPDEWLPPENKCGYIIKWIDIKYSYKLTITMRENTILKSWLNKCT